MKGKDIGIMILALAALICGVFALIDPSQIAYVRSGDLIKGYSGTIEAKNNLESGTSFMRNTIDSLQYQVEFKLTEYFKDSGIISTNEKVERQRELYFLQQNLARVQEQFRQKATQKDAKLTEGVLNQINSFVEQYGKQNGYKIILGTNNTGTLLYAEETIDITDELLEALNKNYHGK